jgi:hypothetical protein
MYNQLIKLSRMKQFIILLMFVIFCGTALKAQTARTDYFLQNSYSRAALNPAFIPQQGYVGVPFLSDLSLEGNTNALCLDNLVFNKNGENVTFLHPEVGSSEFLSRLPDNSNFSADLNYQILSYAFFDKNGQFWSIGLGLKVLSDVNLPKPFFKLLKEGFTANDGVASYQIRDLNASVSAYSELSVGHARTFLDSRLTVGAKAKLLFGAVNMDLNIESLDVTAKQDLWTARSKATLKGAGIKGVYNDDGLFNSIEMGSISPSNFGLGLDLGAVYTPFENAKISLAFTDLGVISWGGSNSVNLATPNSQVEVVPGDKEATIGGGDFDFKESLDASINEIREIINFKETNQEERRTKMLRTTMNLGFEYDVLPGNLSAGLLSSTYLRNDIHTELTLSANYNPADIKWLSAALSYSFLYNSEFQTFGLAVHLAPSKGIHFFLASDYLMPKVSPQFLPVAKSAFNFQFGLAVPLGAKKQ